MDLIIHDGNWQQHVSPVVNGQTVSRGLVPRPAGFATACLKPMKAVNFPLIPRSEWAERIRDKVAAKSQLSDIRLRGDNGNPIKSLDQNGQGYCWAYGSTMALIMLRAAANLPHVRLSAHAIGCMVKGFRDEGGWGALSLDFIVARGVPSVQTWPEKSMSRANDKPATWEDAAQYKVVESWMDTEAAVYDRNLSFEQQISLLLSNVPEVGDYDWWGHCVCGLDAVDGASQRGVTRAESGKLMDLAEFDLVWGMNNEVAAGIGKRIQNSWTDSWGDRGMGVLTGNQAISNNSVAPRAA